MDCDHGSWGRNLQKKGSKGMLDEFKAFIAQGNVLQLAVAVIIGAAFGTIVTSLTDDMIMPVVGAIFGGLDFSNFFLPLAAVPEGTAYTLAAVKAAGVPVLAWGKFVSVILNFLILAFIIFQLVKIANKLMPPAPAAPAGPSEVDLLTEIRDALKKG
jgi:large conductance mechanosensitive channel